MANELAIASAEINEILRFLPNEEVSKVPEKLRQTFEELADQNYISKIDSNKRLIDQNISEKAKDIIALLYRKYWCSPEEKKVVDSILIKNEKEYQKNLREKYNPDNIFKEDRTSKLVDTTVITETNNISEEEYIPVEENKGLNLYKESIFSKIVNQIKQLMNSIKNK